MTWSGNPDPDWRDYAATLLEIHAPGMPTVDLRQPLSRAIVRQLRTLGLGRTWGVLTAHNPAGRELSASENVALEHRLADEVLHLNIPHLRIDGVSPDRTHREVGLGLGASLDQIRGLARCFGQLAVFWFDGDGFRLIPADSDGPGIRLPLDSEDPAGIGGVGN